MKKFKYLFLLIALFNFSIIAQEETEVEDTFNSTPEIKLSEVPVLEKSLDMSGGAALRWKLNIGDIIEIRKKSIQDIKITGEDESNKLFQSTNIQRDVIHRIILNTIGIDQQNGYLVEGSFHSQVNYNQNQSDLYQEEDSQESSFYIQPRGTFIVPPGNYMPNVRNIPVFPLEKDPNFKKNELKDGDTWVFPGFEIMRVDEIEQVPLNVKYEYRGSRKITNKGAVKILHKILYNIEFNHKFKKTLKPDNPKQMFGYVSAKLLWDEKAGIPYYTTEDYNLVIMYNNGVSHEFKIVSKTNYYKKEKLDQLKKEEIRKNLEYKLAQLPEINVSVESTNKGISVQIPDILFDTNSSQLSSESIAALQNIGKILNPFLKDHQLLIKGHTDNVGNIKFNEELSKNRAYSVARYLIKNLKIPLESLSYEGAGSKFPVSDNDSASGRKKNRRVEIILLDN
ncbi:MAG: OmpA family protein [Spirochaetia bacterium]|nr:OmpA family protein [Spirochaetia bacterium]